jgi:hypothetical protein
MLRCMSQQMADIVAKVGEGRLGRNNRIATSKSLINLTYRGPILNRFNRVASLLC